MEDWFLQGSTWETIYEHDDFQMLEQDPEPESDDSDFEFEVHQWKYIIISFL